MPNAMTPSEIKAWSDSELENVIACAQAEQKARAEKRKQDIITKIKELAAGLPGGTVTINGTRGRPPKTNEVKAKKPLLKP
jgi:hypothetical protein